MHTLKFFVVIAGLMFSTANAAACRGNDRRTPSTACDDSYNAFMYQEFAAALSANADRLGGNASLVECDVTRLVQNQDCYIQAGEQRCTGRFVTSSRAHLYPNQIIFSCFGEHVVLRRSAKNIAISRRFLESHGLAHPEVYSRRSRAGGRRPYHQDYCNYAYNNRYPVPRGCW